MQQVNELYHHGILGQKWGIRRFQNYDGSYTQKGVKRYQNSKEKYENSKKIYEHAKKIYKSGGVTLEDGRTLTVTKNVVKDAKAQMKSDRKKMNKDYKHLAEDKRADKGKARYARGETITGNHATTSALATIGTLSLYAAKSDSMHTSENTKKALMAIGGLSYLTAAGSEIRNAVANRQLRSYYAHTSNY